MPQRTPPYPARKISQQASEWFVLLESGTVTPAQREDFQRWLAQSPEHQQAWQETQTVWQGLSQLNPAELTTQTAKTPIRQNFLNPQRLVRPLFAGGLAAVMLVIVIIKLPYWTADYTAATGETSLVTLSDGSTVELDSGSAMSVKYTENRRLVILHKGEAYFTVAANPSRPFDVSAANAEIRALGTEFDVNMQDGTVQIAVTEHAVRVNAGDESLAQLASGHAVSITDSHIGAIASQPVSATAPWRQHQLIFADRRLDEVIDALNRYRNMPVFMLGSGIKNLTVTGLFDTQDTDTALQTITETLAVKLRRLPGGIVILTAT